MAHCRRECSSGGESSVISVSTNLMIIEPRLFVIITYVSTFRECYGSRQTIKKIAASLKLLLELTVDC